MTPVTAATHGHSQPPSQEEMRPVIRYTVVEHLPKSQKRAEPRCWNKDSSLLHQSPAIPSGDRKPTAQFSNCSSFAEDNGHKEGWKRVKNRESPTLHQSTFGI